MKKSEFKTGMRVTLRSGNVYIVYLGTDEGNIIVSSSHWTLLDCYDENFESNENEDLDIMVVHARPAFTQIKDINNVPICTLYERDKIDNVEEITVIEAINRLEAQSGKKIKITNI